MIEIIKSKGKTYKTDSPEKALEVYRNSKNAVAIISDGAVIRSKFGTGETGGRLNQQYLKRS